MRYYVVSDIHGFYDEFIEALTEKGWFEDKEPHKLIICGDLLDRGTQTNKIVSFVHNLMHKDQVILIRGNHEDMLLKLIAQLKEKDNIEEVNIAHWHNGTVDTVSNYVAQFGTDIMLQPRLAGEQMEHSIFCKKIIPAMLNYYETEHYIFTHGWIPVCYDVLADKHEYMEDWRNAPENYWYNARWLHGISLAVIEKVIEPNKTIVCGHWHCAYGHALEGDGDEIGDTANNSPYYNEGIIAIDACTAMSGKVNCIVIED